LLLLSSSSATTNNIIIMAPSIENKNAIKFKDHGSQRNVIYSKRGFYYGAIEAANGPPYLELISAISSFMEACGLGVDHRHKNLVTNDES
jgi:hypothetical protein